MERTILYKRALWLSALHVLFVVFLGLFARFVLNLEAAPGALSAVLGATTLRILFLVFSLLALGVAALRLEVQFSFRLIMALVCFLYVFLFLHILSAPLWLLGSDLRYLYTDIVFLTMLPSVIYLLGTLFGREAALYTFAMILVYLVAILPVSLHGFAFFLLACTAGAALLSSSLRGSSSTFSVIGLFVVLAPLLGSYVLRFPWASSMAFPFLHLHRSFLVSYIPEMVGTIFGALLLLSRPLLEMVLNSSNVMRLRQLNYFTHPLLTEMRERAPGTYFHTLSVCELAAAAAQSIGANADVTRLAVMFHDVGKIASAGFFTENQGLGVNPHDALTSSRSTKIIRGHMQGELQKELRPLHLPPSVIHAIISHHGTRVIRYFYSKALQEFGSADEDLFRYRGPRPETKEATIVMLADSIEAASRSLVRPTQGEIRDLCTQIIRKIAFDEQLSYSPLSLRELAEVQRVFETTVRAQQHSRVQYPSEESAAVCLK